MIDIPGLLKILELFQPFKNAILGRVYSNAQIVRNPMSKWYLSKAEFPAHSLGIYCQGMAYSFSFNLLSKMYENLHKVQYLWMDDWYVTHALLFQSQAIYFDLQNHYISTDTIEGYQKVVEKKEQRKKLLFGHFRPKSRFV
uniref:Hexosyltransferase n=1 Tax=Panagrolaimus superbus TaxID=310955 RepID=A0A914YIJ8_9BILA